MLFVWHRAGWTKGMKPCWVGPMTLRAVSSALSMEVMFESGVGAARAELHAQARVAASETTLVDNIVRAGRRDNGRVRSPGW